MEGHCWDREEEKEKEKGEQDYKELSLT
jgi:hypothetical protein